MRRQLGRLCVERIRTYPLARRNRAVSKPRILKIRQGKTGELLVYFTPLYRKAVHYELRHGAQGADGMPPETWTGESLLQARRPARIENLTPGTIYVFQVRA